MQLSTLFLSSKRTLREANKIYFRIRRNYEMSIVFCILFERNRFLTDLYKNNVVNELVNKSPPMNLTNVQKENYSGE